jgi:hypothetical protein
MAMNADRAIALICGIIGAFWAATGWFSYGVWVNKGPGPGFLPVIFGSLTVIFCIARLLRADKDAEPIDPRAVVPIAAIIVCALVIYVIGFLPATFLLIAFWLVNQGAYSYKFSIFLAATIILFIWGVFGYWLQVPFPTGLITY